MIPPNNPPPDPALGPPEHPYALFRNRNLRLYLIGRFVASFGQQMVTVGVGWELYDRTGSALALGLVGLAHIIPMFLFTLPAGHFADHHDRKRIILWMTCAIAACSLGLTVASAAHAPVLVTYLCLFGAATARTFLWPASLSFLPSLVPRRDFPRAIAWSTSSFQLSSVSGPAAGGLLIALTGRAATVFAFNTAAALTCAFLVSLVHHQRIARQPEPMTLSSLVAGFKFVFANRIISGIITLDMFAVLLGGANALLPIYAKDILHTGARGLGFLEAALPAGSLLSAVILAHRPPINKAGSTLLWAVTGFGMATIGFALSKWFWLSWAMLFLCGMTDNISVVIRHTLVQLLTPDEKRGRVSAVNSLFIGTSNELGGFESGVVAHWFGPVVSAVTGGIGTFLAVIGVAFFWPEVRNYGPLGGRPGELEVEAESTEERP